ncbi:MAG: type II toxin-antitoxin system RelE/ParE family toxin [Anaerolineae bacterium]
MSRYQPVFEDLFVRNQRRYRSLRKQIQRRVDQVLDDPYTGTERLGRIPGRLDLRGCRSVHVTRNFRIIFVVCEECRQAPGCRFCFCEGLQDKAVVFLTVGPHEKAYSLREVEEPYTLSNGES